MNGRAAVAEVLSQREEKAALWVGANSLRELLVTPIQVQ